MDPPCPPLPPFGPPRGTNFSRRKLMLPLPPSPALISMSTSSTNMGLEAGSWSRGGVESARQLDSTRPRGSAASGLFDDREHVNHAAVRAVIGKLDESRHLGEQGVV